MCGGYVCEGGMNFPKDEDENMLQCNMGGINFLGGACNETLPQAPPPCITVILPFEFRGNFII